MSIGNGFLRIFVTWLLVGPLAEQAQVIKTFVSDEPYQGTLSKMLDTTGGKTTSTRAVHYTIVRVGNVLHLLSCTPKTIFSKCPTITAGSVYDFRIEKSKALLTNSQTKKPIGLEHVASEIIKP